MEFIRYVFTSKNDPNQQLIRAIEDNNLEEVNRLLTDPLVDPSANNNEAIRSASIRGHVAIVERLLKDRRVDPSVNTKYALRYASSLGSVALVEQLLKDQRGEHDDSD